MPDQTPPSATRDPCKIHAVVTTPGVLVCRVCGSKIEPRWLNEPTTQSAPSEQSP